MSYLIPSSFSSYHLTDEELTRGQILNTENIQVIQNLISACAEEKLALKFDPVNTLAFAQREAELQGQIGILKMLVEMSAAASSQLSRLSTQE